MRPHPSRAPRLPLRTATPDPAPASRGRERRQRQAAADLATVARCPRCLAPLIARMGRRGPYFHCVCAGGGAPG